MSNLIGEGGRDQSDLVSSVEASYLAMRTLGECVNSLREQGDPGRIKNGKRRFDISFPGFSRLEWGTPEYDEKLSNALTSSVVINAYDEPNGSVSSAEIIRISPYTGPNSTRGAWHARFMFPPVPAELLEAQHQRTVLDIWTFTTKGLYERRKLLSKDDFADFVYAFHKKGSNGIPAGADGHQHYVFGRDGEEISPGQARMLEDILGYFVEGCTPVTV